MSDLSVSVRSSQPTPVVDKPQHKITGKVRRAIELMVWDALPRDHAAEQAGLKGNGLYKALRKPAVKAAYLAELEVLRTSERARNIHRLVQIRDAADNMPAVQAIDRLERMDELQLGRGGVQQSPGFVIQVLNVTAPGPSADMPHIHQIEQLPNDINASASHRNENEGK